MCPIFRLAFFFFLLGLSSLSVVSCCDGVSAGGWNHYFPSRCSFPFVVVPVSSLFIKEKTAFHLYVPFPFAVTP